MAPVWAPVGEHAYALVQVDTTTVRATPALTQLPISPPAGSDLKKGDAVLVRKTGLKNTDGEWWLVTTPGSVTGYILATDVTPAKADSTASAPAGWVRWSGSTAATGQLLGDVLSRLGNLNGLVREGWNDPSILERVASALERVNNALGGLVNTKDTIDHIRGLVTSIRARIAELRVGPAPVGAETGALLPNLQAFPVVVARVSGPIVDASGQQIAFMRAGQVLQRGGGTFPVRVASGLVFPNATDPNIPFWDAVAPVTLFPRYPNTDERIFGFTNNAWLIPAPVALIARALPPPPTGPVIRRLGKRSPTPTPPRPLPVTRAEILARIAELQARGGPQAIIRALEARLAQAA